MFSLPQSQNSPDLREMKLKRLTQEFEQLNQTIDNFFADLGVTDKTLAQYVQMKEQFSSEDWNKLNEERLLLEEKLKKDINSLANPLETKKKYEERKVAPHWLFVR